MARTVIVTCDRCGKEYSDNDRDTGFIAKKHIVTVGLVTLTWRNNEYELCPDCMDKLERFLDMEND